MSLVVGLILLKYISHAFEEQHAGLDAERKQGADPEHPGEYRAKNLSWVPRDAPWPYLNGQAKQSTIGQLVDDVVGGLSGPITSDEEECHGG